MGAETQRVGDIFLRFGMLDPERLRRVLARQQELRGEGKVARIGEVAVDLGFLKPDQVKRVLAHEGTALLRCPKCDHRYTVPNFQGNRRYKCGGCKAYLEFSRDHKIGSLDAIPTIEQIAGPPPPPKPESLIGRKFGDYELRRLVGKGGMGSVFEAEHVRMKRRVAIKILADQYARMPDVVKRFKREATAGGKLAHSNIAQIHDIDEQDGLFYIVSEFVEGRSLEKLLQEEGKLRPERAVKVLRGILAGLQHAHDAGIVHRDIKPGNVLLTTDEIPKLIDFGIAKDAESQTMLTLAGSVLGSPSYMSPEQAQGGEVGPWSDQYSSGTVLFALLTGRKPYEGKNLVETLAMHVNSPVPSLRSLVPETPETVERVVHRMMAKNPGRRYPSASAASLALGAALKGEAEKPPAPARGRRVPEWFWITLAIVCGAVSLAILLLWLLS